MVESCLKLDQAIRQLVRKEAVFQGVDMAADRIIFHCDINNCYASIEQVCQPHLRGKAVAVCGAQADRHGIVLAKSNVAKAFGIKTGEPIWAAKQKCPQLEIVPPRMALYEAYSRAAHRIYLQFTDRIEPFGLDECWLDVTGSIRLFGSVQELAHAIRRTIKAQLGITISLGVSFCKTFAKLGSDLQKPDAVTFINRENYIHQIGHIEIDDLMGIGRKTRQLLNRYGIFTLADLYGVSFDFLEQLLGLNGVKLWRQIQGLERDPVRLFSDFVSPKSVGRGQTCRQDIQKPADVHKLVMQLAQRVSSALKQVHAFAQVIQISIKKANLEQIQCQLRCAQPIQSVQNITQVALQLFEQHYDWQLPVRAMTIRAIQLTSERPVCESLDLPSRRRQNEIDQMMYDVRARFGAQKLCFATQLKFLQWPMQTSDIVSLPGAFGRSERYK